ncbi:hypothetical protein EMCRGX_G005023 [Ephydatia muelleri]
MARPTVTPGKFSGEESWDQWIFHFESAADINKWDAAAKLQWLKISLTGRALASFQRLSPQSIADYKTAKETLLERFEPSCRRERYQTELQTAKRKKEEEWADLADRLRIMAQKDKAKEQLALNVFLSLIDNSQVAFAVRQRRPATLDTAVSATLEIECYADSKSHVVGGVTNDQLIGGAGTSPSTAEASGKRQSFDGVSLPTEGCEQKARTETVVISNLFQESFFLYGNVKGVGLKLLVDTGAAASLLDSKIWSKINEGMLEKWEGPRLDGVDASPLKVLGRAKIQLNIGASLVTTSVIITDNLTSDGILGMDFLQDNSCTIDIPRKKLILAGGTVFHLCQKASLTYDVRLAETTIIPPRCEIEVVGKSELPPYGLWLLEGHHLKSQSVVIARAILETCTFIPVRVLNASNQSITFRQGTTIGELHRIEEWQIGALSSPAENRTCPIDKANVLHQLAQSPTSISDEQRGRLFALLQQYADVLACPGQKLGQTSKVQHAIHTSSSLPIRQHPRRTPPAQRTVVKELIKEMMDNDIIQPSKSGWASPIVLAKKKDGSVRFCVDYRKLNEVTRKDAYPLPRIDDTLEMLSESQLFSTLDLASGYWQVELEEEDRAKTAFCTNEGMFEFKVMPMLLLIINNPCSL